MTQVSNSEDVYRHLVEEATDDWLMGLVAFAIIEEQRIEWLQHCRDNNEVVPSDPSDPSDANVTRWYRQLPDGMLLRAKGDAQSVLSEFCDDVIDVAVREEREKILKSVVVEEIKLTRRFWPQFGIGVAAGLTSAILFTTILVILWFYGPPIPFR